MTYKLTPFAEEALREIYVYEQKVAIRRELGAEYALPGAYINVNRNAVKQLIKRNLAVQPTKWDKPSLTPDGAALVATLNTQHEAYLINRYRHECVFTKYALQHHDELSNKVIQFMNERFNDTIPTDNPRRYFDGRNVYITIDMDGNRSGWIVNLQWYEPLLEIIIRLDGFDGDYFIRIDSGESYKPDDFASFNERLSAAWDMVVILRDYTQVVKNADETIGSNV